MTILTFNTGLPLMENLGDKKVPDSARAAQLAERFYPQ